MAAIALSFSEVETKSVGNRTQGVGTLTMVASTSTYTDGGIALPTGWRGRFGAYNKLDFAELKGPLVASTIDLAYTAFIDMVNEKLVIFGTPTQTLSPRLTYTATTLSAAASDNSINDSALAIPAFVANEPINIVGFTGTVANNQPGYVVSRTTGKLVVNTAVAFVNDTAGESVTISSGWQSVGDAPLEELPNGTSITDGTYTATLLVQGY